MYIDYIDLEFGLFLTQSYVINSQDRASVIIFAWIRVFLRQSITSLNIKTTWRLGD